MEPANEAESGRSPEETKPSRDASPAGEPKPSGGERTSAADAANEGVKAGEGKEGKSTPPPPYSPDRRALVHFAALIFAFPLTWLADQQGGWVGRMWAAGGCMVLVLFNLFGLFRLFPGIRRPEDGRNHGVWLYPLSLGVAFLVFPAYAVGAAWAALAAGDAAATVFGRRVPKPALPWNRKKSWVGLFAFFLAAALTAALLLWWCPCPEFLKRDPTSGALSPEWPYVWTLAALGAFCGAVLESLEGPFDDNLRVALGTGLVVWLIAAFLNFFTSGMPPDRAFQPEWLIHALIANGVLVAVLLSFRFVDLQGALAGGVIGTLIYFLTLWPGYLLLLLFVGLGSLLSRVGRSTKEQRKVVEARGGKRGLSNVLANLVVPLFCALGYAASKGSPAALWAYAGALAAALADTASAEIGTLSPSEPWLITSRKTVPHGTNGAVSRVGYVGAFSAVMLLVVVGWLSGFWRIVLHGHGGGIAIDRVHGVLLSIFVLAAGFAGTTADSFLGATVEDRPGGLNKHGVNFLCTLAGALVAGAAGLLLG